MPEAPAPLDLFAIFSGLFGGLALFLLGLDMLSRGLKAVAGDRMRQILARLTGNRFLGVTTGAVVTAAINSSSVTTVLVVGFISAGILGLHQAVWIIMGANIGSTFTAQVIAFNISRAALPMIAVGYLSYIAMRGAPIREYGTVVMGLGMIFLGMEIMSAGMSPLRTWEPFVEAMARLQNPILGILAGAVFTAVVQSSAATTGLVIVLASQGLMTLEAGIAVALGANIGTCATAMLASIGKPVEAVRAAVIHVLFNVAGVVLWVLFIPQLAWLSTSISPASPHLEGTARLAAEVPRQIANAHTLFNVANTLIMVWFSGLFVVAVKRLLPDHKPAVVPLEAPQAEEARHLKAELLSAPVVALDAVRRELGHMGQVVGRMLTAVLPAALAGSRESLEKVAAMDGDVDALHAAIIDYLRQLGHHELSRHETRLYSDLMEIANILESIGDLIETDLVNLGRRRVDQHIVIGESMAERLRSLHGMVAEALSLALSAIVERNEGAARTVVAMKTTIATLAASIAEEGARSLRTGGGETVSSYTREIELIEKLRRVYYYAKRIAHLCLNETKEEAAKTETETPAETPIPPLPPAETEKAPVPV